ncbi:hypothetical protein [Microbacterium sp. SS28]|uniref:hypothetical protein n=1 Tax=Microbacterium sp. SS28 TaxID=2919948 RepID=UPI001FAA9C1C|nr:hypothetical protein [Microbacterium sp. SS28]
MDQILTRSTASPTGSPADASAAGGAIVAAHPEDLPYAETCIDCQSHVESP